MQALDLTGRRFGRLVVVRQAKKRNRVRRWECLCDCGKTTVVYRHCLMRGFTRSCGCLSKEQKALKGVRRFKDIKGQRFGRLLVLERSLEEEKRRGSHDALWSCLCDCGETKVVHGGSLRNGNTSSCGCWARESSSIRAKTSHTLPVGVASFNNLVYIYKRNARLRGYTFILSKDRFRELVSGSCYYCGSPPDNVVQERYGRNGGLRYSGIDRKDNSVGYEDSNCVSCCRHCNKAKGTRTLDEFKVWVFRLADQLKKEQAVADALAIDRKSLTKMRRDLERIK